MKLSRKEKEEFEMIVKKNMRRGYYAALGILGSHDDAVELSQQAFVKAYKNFKKFDKSKNFFTWYYTILRNLCFNFIRDNKKFVSLENVFEKSDPNVYSNPAEEAESNQRSEIIKKALDELDEEDREIIVLREFQNHSYKEISEMLNIPEGTVMSRLFYARKKLAAKLEGVEL
ncbi:MAG: sigma-70 family RNA polymerase sigma factor [Ignavibacteria bacterium]|nr:MAG: sigma-70 family RNA polymerase sigma factor [Ignavibacteria bacterium]